MQGVSLVNGTVQSGSGSYKVTDAELTLGYGNSGTGSNAGTASFTFTCIPIPTITSLNAATGPASGGTTVTVTGADFVSGATVLVDGVPASNVTILSKTSLSFVTPPHAAAAVNLQITNAGGTTATMSNAFTYYVSSTSTISALSATAGPAAGGTSVTAAGSGFVVGNTGINIGGTIIPAANVTVNSSTSLSFVTPAHAAGNVTVMAVLPDGMTDPVAGGFTYLAVPTATNLTPTFGPPAGGTTVFVVGSGFLAGNTGVTIGGNAIPASSVAVTSGTFLSFVTPAHAVGNVPVTVTTPGGTSGAPSSGFTYAGVPTAASLTPGAGPVAGNTPVTVTGTNFVAGKTSVTIGGTAVPAASVTVASDTTLTFNTPAHAAGTVAVTVANPAGTSSAVPGGYVYAGVPTASAMSAYGGPAAGNTAVTVTGTNFVAGSTSVTIGGTVVPASSVTVASATALTFTTPAHAAGSNLAVTITTPGGTSGAIPNGYTYAAVPVVTAVSPNAGPIAGGGMVTISGSGFAGATPTFAVKFGGTNAFPYYVDSDTQIRAEVPGRATGTVDVTVRTPYGGTSTPSAADVYSYAAAPVAGAFTLQVPAGVPTPIGLSDAITGGSHTSIEVTTQPTHGTVSIAGDLAAYTPDAGFTGGDSFAYKAIGIGGTSSPATVSLTVQPVGQAISFAALADASLSASPLTLTATASSGQPVRFTSATTAICTVAGDTLTLLQTGTCTIDADQAGGGIWTAAATVSRSFTVTPANLAITTAAASGASVGASYSQANTATGGVAPYSYALAVPGSLPPGTAFDPASGKVSGTPTMAGNFSYAVSASDSQTPAVSALGTVNVTIAKGDQTIGFTSIAPSAAVGGAPYVVGATASSGLAVVYALDGTSTGCALSGTTVSFTGTGTCRIDASQPGDANWNAAAQIQQSITIGTGHAITAAAGFTPSSLAAGATGTMTIRFSNPNAADSPPVTAVLNVPALVTRANGAPGGSCAIGSTAAPIASVVQFNDVIVPTGGCTITLDYIGVTPGAASGFTLSLSTPSGYTQSSATGSGGFAVVPSVTGISPGSGPVSQVVTISGTGFSAVPGDNLVRFGAAAGVVTAASPTALTVTAPATGSGAASVSVTVNGQVSTGGTTYTFIDKPAAADRSDVAVPFGGTGAAIDLSGAITGGPHGSIAVGTAPVHGTVTIAGDVVTYTPAAAYYGVDSFTYVATGPGGSSAPATVTLNIAVPPAPTAADKAGVAVAYDSPGTAIDLSSLVGGMHSSIAIGTAPAHGTASVAGDVVTYVPTAGYFGADSFTWTAIGPGGTSAAATVGLSVATPPAPIAAPGTGSVDGRTTTAGTSVSIDLSTLVTGVYDTIQIATQPAHGVVTLGAPAAAASARARLAAAPFVAIYTPAVNFAGTDSFTFIASGPGGNSAPGTVTIAVVGQVPVAAPKIAKTGDGQAMSVVLTDGAVGGPFTGAAVVSLTPAGAATTAIAATGSGGYRLDVTPNNRFGGTIVVTYTLSNVFGASLPSTVTLTVEARPDPRGDPNVAAISDAQAEAARRFARAQVSNFMRRNEQLHNGGGQAGLAMGVTLGARDATTAMQRPDDKNWGLAITERMRMSGEDPALGQFANNPGSPFSRGDTLGNGRMFARDPHAVGASGAARQTDKYRAAGEDEADGTRRIGSVATWAGGAIDIGTRDATTDRTKVTATTAGLSAGADVKLAGNLLVGLGGGYGNDLSRIGSAAQVRGKSTIYAAYASLQPGRSMFLDGMVGRGQLDFTTRRIAAAVDSLARGKRGGSYTVAAVSLGIDRSGGALQWSLYGRGEYLGADLDAYAEAGASRYDLRFDARAVQSLTGAIGGTVQLRRKTGFGSVTPRVRAEWSHEFADVDAQWLDYADIPGAAIYALSGNGWKREQMQLSLGARFDILSGGWSFDAETGLRAGEGEKAGTLQLRLSKSF
ncbi:IPT/TIG domain-containing protein [Sphingomonas sp. KR3-1]|uniref:IPT/TIG domain-containing protein n=1 Tax=Sphingomonas sp. KR3-1 TaxID=3156611 RepID=UPI0032B3A33D